MRAVLYCRVSSLEQTKNLSLATQEEACRQYCQKHGYDVDQVFVDAGESAKTTDRPEFQRMLAACRHGRGKLHAVVVYSLTRFSRNSADHHAIATLLRGLGIALRSVTEPIDDSPSGRLMEGILASMAQFDNDVRSERVTAGMQAAVDRGRWVWPAPLGYVNGHRGGPSLLPDPERAPAVREAFACAAAGIVGAALLQRVRELHLTTKHGHPVSQSRLYELLRQPVYAGLIRTAAWGKDVRGDFAPIVDETTFTHAQAQLSRSVPRGPAALEDARHLTRHHDDAFPLRRFVRCVVCGLCLTGSASRSRNGHAYGFYHCRRGCVRIAKAALEQQFVALLDTLRPCPAYWKILRSRVLETWREQIAGARDRRTAARARLQALEQKLARLEDAYIYQQAIDERSYVSRRDPLREAIALESLAVSDATEETLDVESLLAFAEHTLQQAGALWTAETSTARRIQLQWAMFPSGLRVAENGMFEPPVSCFAFFEFTPRSLDETGMVDHLVPRWNRLRTWLTTLPTLRAA